MTPSPVSEHLWIGRIPSPGTSFHVHFDRLVLISKGTYNEYSFPDLLLFQVPIDNDVLTPGEEVATIQTGHVVASWVRRKKIVLLTCGEGLCLSGLIAGVALICLGATAPEAIEKVQAARGLAALDNLYFRSLLLRTEGALAFRVSA